MVNDNSNGNDGGSKQDDGSEQQPNISQDLGAGLSDLLMGGLSGPNPSQTSAPPKTPAPALTPPNGPNII